MALIRNGESLFLIRLAGDRVQLLPAASWDVRGGITPESWFYRVDIFGPTADSPTSQIVSGAQVLHFRYATSPARPWYGGRPVDLGKSKRTTGRGDWKPGLPGKHRDRAGTSCQFRKTAGTVKTMIRCNP